MKKILNWFILLALSTGSLQAATAHPSDRKAAKISTDTTSHKNYFAPSDIHIQYIGRWNTTNPKSYTSYWGGAYFKARFTGTSIKISLGHKSNYYVSIDNGPWMSYKGVEGMVDLTPAHLSGMEHTISVAQGKDYDYIFDFKGLVLAPGAKLLRLKTKKSSHSLIEWIGDSITTGYTDPQANVSDYAWVCSSLLGAEHTQIAYPGIDLVSGYHGQGMDIQYQKERSLKFPDAAPWDFSRYCPDIMVLNLGTNDVNNHVPAAIFEKSYINFIQELRRHFPKAEIFVMRTFSGAMAIPTKAAVQILNQKGDKHIHYIDTEGWLVKSTDDFTDGTHPSISGHIKVAQHLKPLLAAFCKKRPSKVN